MKKISFKTGILLCTIGSGILTVVAFALYRMTTADWLQATAITFFTTFYHFAMRLAVGRVVPNRFDHSSRWFQPKPFEEKLYKVLKVKRWKAHMPTYEPRLFSLTENGPQQILANMCQAEVVHEIIILCSFLPLLFAIFWGTLPVFLITSILAAGVDALFVMLQRYNRPRVLRLLQKKGNHHV